MWKNQASQVDIDLILDVAIVLIFLDASFALSTIFNEICFIHTVGSCHLNAVQYVTMFESQRFFIGSHEPAANSILTSKQ